MKTGPEFLEPLPFFKPDPLSIEKCNGLDSDLTDLDPIDPNDIDRPVPEELGPAPLYFSEMKSNRSNVSTSKDLPTGIIEIRRKSVSSNRSTSTGSASMELRFELERQRHEAEKHGGLQKNQHGISWYSLEAKTLNFTQLAFDHYGKSVQWKDVPTAEQVDIIREALTSKVFLINPLSRQMKYWDMLIVVLLLFTAVVTPYECAFLEQKTDHMYAINWFVTAMFVLDMLLQFFLKVKKRTKQGSIWLRERKKIANAYIRSWFLVDILSVIPYDDFANLVPNENQATMENLKVLRLIRVLRLIKLVRMFKASRLMRRWENSVSLTSAHMYLIKFAFLVLTAVHWMACMWGLVGKWDGSNLKCRKDLSADDPLLDGSSTGNYFVLSVDKDANDPSAWEGYSWIVSFALNRAWERPVDPCDAFTLYIVSLYWAVMTMTSIGYGDILPQTFGEYIVCIVCMMVGSVVWAYIIGAVSAILSNMYPEETVFEQRLDSFNAMVREQDIPQAIRHRGREYIREAKFHTHYQRNLEAIRGLGIELRGVISRQLAEHYLENIWFFARSSPLFRGDCAAQMTPYFFEHREVIQLCGQLCVVERGAVGYDGRVLVPWSHWGEDFVLSCDKLRMNVPPVALTFAEIVSLKREDVNALLAQYPDEMKLWRRAAACVALMRAVRLYRRAADARPYGKMDKSQAWVLQVFEGLQNEGKPTPAEGTNSFQLGDASSLEDRLERLLKCFNAHHSGKGLVDKGADARASLEDEPVQVIDLDQDISRQGNLVSMQAQLDRMEAVFKESMAALSEQIARMQAPEGDAAPRSAPCWNCSRQRG